MEQKVWFVNGCSSGLGRQLIQTILQRGDKAIATARKPETLQDLADAGAATLQLDVTVSQQVLNEKAKEAVKAFGHVDVVVHNAGFFQMGAWEDLTYDLLQAQLNTNLAAVVNVTRAMMPHLRERNRGTFVFVHSSSAWQTYPGVSSYGASKAALDRMIEGFAREVGSVGMKCLLLDAGGFDSQLVHNAPALKLPSEHHGQLMDMLSQAFTQLVDNPLGDSVKLANLIVDLVKGEGMAQGKEIPLRYPVGPDGLFEEWANMTLDEIPLVLPVGSDALETIKAKCEMTLKVIREWEDVIRSTDTGPASLVHEISMSSK